MKAIAIVPAGGDVHLVDRPEPAIGAPDDIKVKILRVGICGTDREQLKWHAPLPDGQSDMIIGHENFGQVVDVGSSVAMLRPGDYCVFTVRRGCGRCLPCAVNRSDMCATGQYCERGIWKADGYQTEYVVDKEQYAIRIPAELEPVGVLTEPLSVAEKAIDIALHIQEARLPGVADRPDWLSHCRCLVVGLGPIGLLVAMVLRLRGATVYGMDIVDEDRPRPRWLEHIAGHYVNGRHMVMPRIAHELGPMDMVFEASGAGGMAFAIVDALAFNGIAVLIGVPGDSRPPDNNGADLVRCMVIGNRVMVGIVNAAYAHFQMAVNDLLQAHRLWGNHIARLITHRYAYTDVHYALQHHAADEIKTVIEWTTTSQP